MNGHTVTFNTGAATLGLRRPSPPRASGLGGINGKTLTFTSFNGGTNGTIKTLDQLNAALGVNNLTTALDAKGNLTISASNDFASSTLGSAVSGGSITSALSWSTASAPVADVNAQSSRSSLVAQYNNICCRSIPRCRTLPSTV